VRSEEWVSKSSGIKQPRNIHPLLISMNQSSPSLNKCCLLIWLQFFFVWAEIVRMTLS
jgi:hypothetical protein